MGRFCEFCGDGGRRCGGATRSKKDRYCPEHEAVMKRQMIDSGYLEPPPAETPVRSLSACEDVLATKFGLDG